MNLLFRLIALVLFFRTRSKLGVLDEAVTPFRVWPTDLDLNRHMNNGKYPSVMDLARIDLMLRCGFSKTLRRERIYPVVASQTIRYRRSLKLFRSFQVRTRVIGWDERFIFLQQTFVTGGEVAATAVVKGIFLRARGGRAEVAEVVELAGLRGDELALPAWVRGWVASEDAAWAEAEAAAG